MKSQVEFIDGDGVVLPYLPGVIRSAYDGSRVVDVTPPGVSLTVQSALAETDLSQMVKRWLKGEPRPEFRMGEFGDVSRVKDLQVMLNVVAAAREGFLSLPAELRAEFRNDAMAFAEYLADPSNEDDARARGILPAVEGAVAGGGSGEGSPPPVSG